MKARRARRSAPSPARLLGQDEGDVGDRDIGLLTGRSPARSCSGCRSRCRSTRSGSRSRISARRDRDAEMMLDVRRSSSTVGFSRSIQTVPCGKGALSSSSPWTSLSPCCWQMPNQEHGDRFRSGVDCRRSSSRQACQTGDGGPASGPRPSRPAAARLLLAGTKKSGISGTEGSTR